MRPTRRQFLTTSATAALAVASGAAGTTVPAHSGKLSRLREVGDDFTFAIIADPQLGHADSNNRVFTNARRTLMQAVADINAMEPQPAFVLFLGDLVNSGTSARSPILRRVSRRSRCSA